MVAVTGLRPQSPQPLRASEPSAVKSVSLSFPAVNIISNQGCKAQKGRYDEAGRPSAGIFVSSTLRVRKGHLHHAAGMSPYLARRRGDREELPESGETPPH